MARRIFSRRNTPGIGKWLTVAPVLAALSLPAAAEQAIIVLDASGSMWGRIGETPKITIARDVLAGVLASAPADLSLGLVAYGHREKGNCSDIELLVAPAPGTGPLIAGAAADLSPKGKTPLSTSVRAAAELLRYTEEKATVILITDGLETCSADPCALARQLEQTGVDFTTHVVGFGLSPEEGRQVACLADETGGSYIQAQDASSLAKALASTVADAAAAAPEPAPEPVAVAQLPEASIDAPNQIEIGRMFSLTWQGPGERFDVIYLYDPLARLGQGTIVRGRRLISSPDYEDRALDLVAPAEPGSYELHYLYGVSRDVIATRAIEVVAAEVSLSAPATVDIGATFIVDWVGPGGRRDSIDVFDEAGGPAGKVISGARLVNNDYENQKAKLVAPAEPGFYLLRYYNGDNRAVLATRQIEVLPAEVSISAPDAVAIGASIAVAWVGPGGRRDAIEIFDETGGRNGNVVSSARLVNGDFDGRTVKLSAPATAGSYLLRYWNGDNRAVLATRVITVEDAEVGLLAPDTVDMGTPFDVAWIGPGANRDAVELFDETAGPKGKVIASKRLTNGDYANRKVMMIAPATPGSYLLRYWNGDSRLVLATLPVSVVAMEVSVSGPDSVGAGQTFTVVWAGPGANRDRIEIFDVGANKVVASKRLGNDDYKNRKATVTAPKAAGQYLVRYWSGDSRVVLAERSLTVE